MACTLTSCALIFCASTRAQGPSETRSDRLFSPSVGQKFYGIAYELANAEVPGEPETEQAIVFLSATMELDSRANYVLPDMISYLVKREAYLTGQDTRYEIRDTLLNLLANYVDESADLEVVTEAVRYLLEQLNSREQREELLKEMLRSLGRKNAALDSELATLLGLLTAEKADAEAATSYLMQAFNSDKYNKLAFAKLAELVPEQIEPAIYLEHLRLVLGENPLEMDAALAFAQYAEKLQLYQTSADAYEYCADLFSYLYSSVQDQNSASRGSITAGLPAQIYLPWMISNYNTQRNQHKCLEIASQLRQSGRFDLLAEAIAGKAAAKIGDVELANRILKAAGEKAIELSISDSQLTVENRKSKIENCQSLAWFYCFADPDADSALDWANRAYSIEPNSPTVAGILAYSLVMNGQTDWARLITDNYETSPIAELALAQIQLQEGQKDSAFETLKSVIAADPGSLEAERAKEILTEHGGEYIPPFDPDITLTMLRNSFGQAVVPAFVRPGEIISARLNLRGNRFSYGSKLGGNIAITNNSSEPLVVSDDGLFTGNIRVDASISGDLNKKIPNLLSIKIRPTLPVEPGRSILIPLRLVAGELAAILLSHPQASVDIEFTAYLDPVTTAEGKLTNRLRDIKPAKVVVGRPGIKPTGKFLRNRFNSLSKGRQGQKIRTAQLFTGLLMEQEQIADREPPYKLMYADWMPAMLKSAIVYNLADDDWVVKVHTMAAMLSLPLDYELINAVAENLNDTRWPVRMMAIFLLTRNQDSDSRDDRVPGGFSKVLNWTAKYDSSKLVRDIAVALGAQPPEETEKPAQPESNSPAPEEAAARPVK